MLAANRILSVDDTPLNLTIIEETFPNQYELSPASDGNAALDIAPLLSPDVVFLEVVMPRSDDCEVCSQMTNGPGSSHSQIMMDSTQTELDAMLRVFYPFTAVCQCPNSIELPLPVTMSHFGK